MEPGVGWQVVGITAFHPLDCRRFIYQEKIFLLQNGSYCDMIMENWVQRYEFLQPNIKNDKNQNYKPYRQKRLCAFRLE
jgi:hypothetical protein